MAEAPGGGAAVPPDTAPAPHGDPVDLRVLVRILQSFLVIWAVVVSMGVGAYITAMIRSDGIHSPYQEVIAPDFAIFWGAGRVAREQGPVIAWDWRALTHEVASTLGRDAFRVGVPPPANAPASAPVGWQIAWNYLPPALLPMIPLSLLPYGLGVAVWLLLGIIAWGAAIWRLWPRYDVVGAALLYPGVLISLVTGQMGLFIAACLCSGLCLIPRRPILAGALLSLIGLKPTMALLLPVALIAGRQWKVLASAIVSGLALAAATTLLLGYKVWLAFFDNLQVVDSWTRGGLVAMPRLASPWALATAIGANADTADAFEAVFTSAAVIAVIWAWRRTENAPATGDVSLRWLARSAVLLTAIPLVPFYFFEYDLVPLCAAIAMIWRLSTLPKEIAGGRLPGEQALLFVAWALTAVPPELTISLGFYPSTTLIILLFLSAIRRVAALPPLPSANEATGAETESAAPAEPVTALL